MTRGRRQQIQASPPARIPALDLVQLVVQRLLRVLSDARALLDALSCADDHTLALKELIAAASGQCRAWPALAPEELRTLLCALLVRITVGERTIGISLSKHALRARLFPLDHRRRRMRLSTILSRSLEMIGALTATLARPFSRTIRCPMRSHVRQPPGGHLDLPRSGRALILTATTQPARSLNVRETLPNRVIDKALALIETRR